MMCYVSNMDKSVAFYRDTLGLEPEIVSPYWSSFRVGQTGRIGLHPVDPSGEQPKSQFGSGWFLGLETNNLGEMRIRLRANVKGELHQTPSGVILNIEDPDGNSIQLIQLGSKIDDF